MAFEHSLSLPTRNIFTALSTDTKITDNRSVSDLCHEIDTGDVYEFNGVNWLKTHSARGGNLASIVSGGGLSGVLNTQTYTISGAGRVDVVLDVPAHGVEVKVRHKDSTAIALDQGILITWDNVTPIVADDALDETKTGPRKCITPEDGMQDIEFDGSDVTKLYMKGTNASADLIVTIGSYS